MKKKIVSIIMCGILLIGFCGCSKKSDAEEFKKEYEALNESTVKMSIDINNPIKYLNFDEVIERLTTGTSVIYFGFPNCPWCRNMIPVLFDVANNNNIDTIYYFNPSSIRDTTNTQYQKLLEILNDYLIVDNNGEKKLYVPDVYFIKDGKIVGNHLSTVKSQTDPHISLTEEQRIELEDIYQDLFNKIK